MDFRVAFKRILMKCCCAGKLRKEQKLYQQQQQIKLNKRKEHKKKKLLHQQQKHILREQKTLDGEKDSFTESSRKTSLKEDRKSSLKQITKSSSINKMEEVKRVQLEEHENGKVNESNPEKETNLRILAVSLTSLDKIPETVNKQSQQPIRQLNKPVISYSCGNLSTKTKLDKDRNRILKSIPVLPLANRFRTNSSIKKSKSEITSITKSYERTLNDTLSYKRSLNRSLNQSIKLDDNNNEQLRDTNSSLTEIIINTNLKQLENQHPDYCHFKI